ncbi:MAG: SAM-dependent methyltransferase BT3209 [Candidatus Jettenia ecosi]|uniref:SAM-dependent methyltransferase BT3209 n=1 Tax=Candidatus Jettenia ecosi TaxID=2494326 RepID=A0A533QAL3_9BACT|nr:MAG: SAM-dependent methyltransferase BT3209 [Candidatus Jettenia ecosi]
MNSIQQVNCNICGVDNTSLIAVQNGYRMVKCKNCGLVYLKSRPDQQTLIKLYADYHQREGKDEDVWARLMEKNFKEVSLLLNKIFPEKGKILDVGCGYGHFIEIMQGCGWFAQGVDPSSGTLYYAKKKGLNVIETSVDDSSFPYNFFDVVTAFYVLEHLPDPLSTAKKIFKMLKPGGVIVIRVPHTTPIVRFLSVFTIDNNLYDAPYHLYDFSPMTITVLLKKAGFSFIQVMPGSPTLPPKRFERVISLISGYFSQVLFVMSRGKFLLPGTSKTIIAVKQIENKVS